VLAHRAFMDKSGELEQRRAARTRRELHQIVINRLEKRARELLSGMTYDDLEQSVLDRELDPWAAADVLLREVDA
jgi:LAO/AO transport system kinase